MYKVFSKSLLLPWLQFPGVSIIMRARHPGSPLLGPFLLRYQLPTTNCLDGCWDRQPPFSRSQLYESGLWVLGFFTSSEVRLLISPFLYPTIIALFRDSVISLLDHFRSLLLSVLWGLTLWCYSDESINVQLLVSPLLDVLIKTEDS